MKTQSRLVPKEVLAVVEEARTIVLASHVKPDGDALGSTLAFALSLRRAGKDVTVFATDAVPGFLEFLPGISEMVAPTEEAYDLFIALDCSDPKRLGDGQKAFGNAKKTLSIDHHATNLNFADVNFVDAGAAATGQLVYDLLREMSLEITPEVATLLFVSICMDTGRFLYRSTSPKTHRIAAELIERGADTGDIYRRLYQSVSYDSLMLKYEILEKGKFLKDRRILLAFVDEETVRRHGLSMEDTEEVVEFLRDIEGVEVSCLVKEYGEKESKVSLRSKERVDVSKIALAAGGGGHVNAAGFTLFVDLPEALKMVEEMLNDPEWN